MCRKQMVFFLCKRALFGGNRVTSAPSSNSNAHGLTQTQPLHDSDRSLVLRLAFSLHSLLLVTTFIDTSLAGFTWGEVHICVQFGFAQKMSNCRHRNRGMTLRMRREGTP
ncbi:unnamed protein product, partial [Ectocarpus sp. 13 AM-2016]